MTAPSTLAPSFSALGASWRLVVVVALCALPGCAEPEPAEVLVDVAPSMSREEAVSELFRNLGEAVAAQKARRSGAAISHWRAAHACGSGPPGCSPLADQDACGGFRGDCGPCP